MSRDYAKKKRAPRNAAGGATRSGTGKHASSGRHSPGMKRAGKKTVNRQSPRRKSPQRNNTPKASQPKGQSGRLSLRWILSLALVGGFAGFIVYLNSLPSPGDTAQTGKSPASADGQAATTSPKKRQDKERFQFYDMLHDSKVVPPVVEAYDPGPPPDKRNYAYMIQTGSFRSQQAAEQQRAKIALQGLRGSVQKITLDSGSVWYRINVGPFDNRSKMNSVIDRLVRIRIEPMVRKVPRPPSEDKQTKDG